MRKITKILVVVLAMLCLTGCVNRKTCDICGKKTSDGYYFYSHPLCSSCYLDLQSKINDSEKAEYNAKDDVKNGLEKIDTKFYKNSSYIVYEGYLKNVSGHDIKFLEMEVKFLDENLNVIDSDHGYVNGIEVIKDGEMHSFYYSVRLNDKIKKCQMSFIDCEIVN